MSWMHSKRKRERWIHLQMSWIHCCFCSMSRTLDIGVQDICKNSNGSMTSAKTANRSKTSVFVPCLGHGYWDPLLFLICVSDMHQSIHVLHPFTRIHLRALSLSQTYTHTRTWNKPKPNPNAKPWLDVFRAFSTFMSALEEAISMTLGQADFFAILEVQGLGFRLTFSPFWRLGLGFRV